MSARNPTVLSILENIEKLFSLFCKIFYVPLHNYVHVRQPEKNVIIAIEIVLALSPHRFGVMLWSHFSVIR